MPSSLRVLLIRIFGLVDLLETFLSLLFFFSFFSKRGFKFKIVVDFYSSLIGQPCHLRKVSLFKVFLYFRI